MARSMTPAQIKDQVEEMTTERTRRIETPEAADAHRH